jgi:hypothetical protein
MTEVTPEPCCMTGVTQLTFGRLTRAKAAFGLDIRPVQDVLTKREEPGGEKAAEATNGGDDSENDHCKNPLPMIVDDLQANLRLVKRRRLLRSSGNVNGGGG